MERAVRHCTKCFQAIPEGRLKAIPGARLCAKCAAKVGGETQLKVTIGGTRKPGSLKITGEEIADIQLQNKPLP